jgi:hypothetical protein
MLSYNCNINIAEPASIAKQRVQKARHASAAHAAGLLAQQLVAVISAAHELSPSNIMSA